jgi:CheY-like chemotaxis protein
VADGLFDFGAHMAEVAQQARSGRTPAKVRRYVGMHEAGLPLDITVRWYPATSVEAMEARVKELTAQGREVWISQGLPLDPGAEGFLASVERKTDLLQDINSVDDFRDSALPRVQGWEQGSWAKLYYDTPARSLTGGTIGFDTNRFDAVARTDSRTIRFEAASGISNVRDLQRQMSARQVLVAYSNADVYAEVESALDPVDCAVQGVAGRSDVAGRVREMGPAEPRVVVLDCTDSLSEGLEVLRSLKGSDSTANLPAILIVDKEEQYASNLRTRVAGIISHPVPPEELRTCVLMTGFRLLGDASALKLGLQDGTARRQVERLLRTVMGFGGVYRRMMARIANLEARPTIAFEFKLVPLAPYEFFFIDYEWSGERHELHRFDWVNSLRVG